MPDDNIISLEEYRKSKEMARLYQKCPLCKINIDNIEGMSGFGHHPENGCKFAGMFRLEE